MQPIHVCAGRTAKKVHQCGVEAIMQSRVYFYLRTLGIKIRQPRSLQSIIPSDPKRSLRAVHPHLTRKPRPDQIQTHLAVRTQRLVQDHSAESSPHAWGLPQQQRHCLAGCLDEMLKEVSGGQ